MSIHGKLKGFISDTVIYGVGSMFSRAFAFFLIPLYTGYLDKAQYANLILLQLIFTVLSFFLALNSGVFFYYYEYKKEKIKQTVFTSWLAYEVVISVLILLLSFFCYPLISPLFELPENAQQTGETFFIPFLLVILQLFPYLIFNTYYNLLRINLNSKRAVVITIVDALLVIVFVVYFLVFAGMGVKGVFLGQLIAKTVLAIGILAGGFYKYLNPKLVSWAMVKRIVAYSSPFFLSSTFLWVMASIDKIMGTQLLDSQAEVAFLGLAMQVTMPIIMLAGIISQSYGPYVMSIRHETDAKQTYGEIFSLVVFASTVISVLLLSVSPFLVDILADETFYPALEIIPLFAIANVINIILTQFCLGLNLTKKNIYIAVATIAGGLLGFFFNLYLQPVMGIKAAGYAQIIAYGITGIIVYRYSQKFMPINYNIKWASIILLIMTGGIVFLNLTEVRYFKSPHLAYFVIGAVTLLILGIIGERKYEGLKLIRKLYTKLQY